MKIFVFLTVILACGHANKTHRGPTGYVIEGHDAEPHVAPYIVSITSAEKYAHSFGGTIIGKDWILTAAHCMNLMQPGDILTVVAGLHAQSNLDSKVQIRKVDFIKLHENYDGGASPSDIALLHLSVPLVYNQFVQPAILPAPGEIYSGNVHLYGWGLYEPNGLLTANILQTAQTKIVDINVCKQLLSAVDETNLCSDSLQKHISGCIGDSGGPLVIEREGVSSEVIGIVSWGVQPCGDDNQPTVHVRVSAYIDWIVKVQHAYNTLQKKFL